ncbi:MAG: DUF2510 domain-containing protein, partial [Nocardioidaceae bacterium]
MTQVPEGWYADPAPQAEGQPPLLRYWDGRQWTEHVHPAAPAAQATQPLQAAQQPAQQPAQGAPYGQAPPAYQDTFAYPAYARRPAGPTTPDGVPLAGWWQRVGAQVLDGLILTVVASVATLPIQLGARGDAQRVLDR